MADTTACGESGSTTRPQAADDTRAARSEVMSVSASIGRPAAITWYAFDGTA